MDQVSAVTSTGEGIDNTITSQVLIALLAYFIRNKLQHTETHASSILTRNVPKKVDHIVFFFFFLTHLFRGLVCIPWMTTAVTAVT